MLEADRQPEQEGAFEPAGWSTADGHAEPTSQRVTVVGWRNWGDHPLFVVFTIVATVSGLILAFRSLRDNDASVSDPCVEVVGRWDWLTTGGIVTVAEGGRLTFHANDLTPVPIYTGNWECESGSGKIATRWNTGFSDQLRLSKDGNRLSGTNDQTGTAVSAVRAR